MTRLTLTVALTLLIGGGLMLRSFVTLINVDPGFDADNVLTQQLFMPPATYADGAAIMGFVDEVIDRSLALPGVVDAGVIYTLPLAGQDEALDARIDALEQLAEEVETQRGSATDTADVLMGRLTAAVGRITAIVERAQPVEDEALG